MNIEIIKLTPDLAEDYVRFFDMTPHWDDIAEHKCYCVCWASADHNAEIKEDGSTASGRREIAKRYVKEGYIQGYLAYCGGNIVGWCNANAKSDCLRSYSWEHFMQSVDATPADNVKSVFCFVIAPDMQRKGLATRLLQRVCDDAAEDGFDYVEAYPKKEFANIADDFMGPAEMYRKHGFVEVANCGDMAVMRKMGGKLQRRKKLQLGMETVNFLVLLAFVRAGLGVESRWGSRAGSRWGARWAF
ncbi:MAG: GNAT family N-acetyltransferase [Clostridiales bacterium]|jgi:GNAT superfamily N-acetyltransferase|nr:GNAT family N-acetyltransferase [Clostridiales bacterium]